MDLQALAREIEPLNYVVMRNWGKMPPLGDLDFFVSVEDADALHKACLKHLDGDPRWFDIRYKGDNYYAPIIENVMLEERQKFGDWWVPYPGSHFLSLYYHGKIHKGDNRYDKELEKIFFDWMNPPRPADGVGFHSPE